MSRTAQRWFVSLTCSCCGHIQEMPLKERVFNCSGCSISIDRPFANHFQTTTRLALQHIRSEKLTQSYPNLDLTGDE
ncbi:zinc ribbon domain-containing protein [Microcoleus sp. herbarium14]|uniref:zinc ribbon domain-containing protein n=1 Tax=Microcoleus sp. herbarium14 TaxID=3055439 RepID=UPI002FCEDA88